MNEPIINPWIFYWIDMLEPIKGLFLISCLLGFGCVAFIAICGEDENIKNRYKKMKRISIFATIMLLFMTFTPTPKTATKMLVASQVTPANLQMVKNEAGEIVEKTTDLSDRAFTRIEQSAINIIKEIKK